MFKSRLVLAAGIVVASPNVTWAQDDASEPQGTAQAAVQGEIIVTARRIGERLQETPVAVTAVTVADLEQKSVINIQEVTRLAPGLNFKGGGGSQTQGYISIRGIGQPNDNPGMEPGVGIYIDDVYIPRSQVGVFDLNDVQQIEVLRGPQGTLYGKNTVGGAVKVTTGKPGPDLGGTLTIGYGNFNERRLAFAINVPVSDRLFVRGSGTIRKRNGYYDNPFDGRKLSDINSMSGRLHVLYRPSSDLEVLLSAETYHDRSIDLANRLIAIAPTGAFAAIEAFAGPLAPYVYVPGSDPRRGGGSDIRFDPDMRFTPRVDWFGTSMQLTWTRDEMTVKSITAYRDLHSVRVLDVDGTPLRVLNIGDETKQRQFSQELQLSGSLWDGRVQYLGGLFYFDESLTHDFRQTIAALGVRSDRLNELGTKSGAAYLNVTFKATDALSMTLGGRYTSEKRPLNTTLRSLPTLAVVTPRFGDSKKFSDFSPKIEIDYKLSPDAFFYVSASKGFKSGGFNNQASDASQLVAYDAETAWSYELGAKLQMFDRRVTLNTALFYMDYKDLQLNVNRTVNNVVLTTVSNAGRAKIGGVEVEGSVLLTDNFNIFGNFSYTDGHYDEFNDAILGDLSASKLLLNKYKYLIGAQYTFDLGDEMKLRVGGDYSWRSSVFTDAVNLPVLKQPSFGLLNARASLVLKKGVELSVFGRNITNEQPLQSGAQALESLGLAWGGFYPGRTYGVEASLRF